MNAVMVGSDAAGPTLYYGAGAGAGPTASAVMADIIDLSRGNLQVPNLGFTAMSDAQVIDISSIRSSYYLRLGVHDRPGVMAHVSSILGNHDVSIEALIQKDARVSAAQIVIVTNEVPESDLDRAIAELESLDDLTSSISRIRVADF